MVNNLKTKIVQYQSRLACRWNNAVVVRYDPRLIDRLHSVLASYFGQFGHAASYRLICSLFQRYWVLNRHFAMNGKVLRRRDQPPRFYNLSGQYRWFCRRYFQSIIFFQVGRYFEFYGRQGIIAEIYFRLRQGERRPRLGSRTGFPIDRLSIYLRMALAISPQVVLIKQTGRYSGNVMERRVHLSFTR